jgi:ATP-dependent Lhr-like helicase
MGQNAFDLLAQPIQRILWQMKWTTLRPIQADAIRLIRQTSADVIIAAQTASGKTEAAFLPVLSCLCELPGTSVRAMYVGPLKALINDQFRRLEDLCEHADIPVFRWHGDVSASQKQKLVEQPSGVLLITPESLESLFVNRSSRMRALFNDLAFVVIDELHAFLGNERGRHLRSLLYRLQRFISKPYRMVGLSATLGDPMQSARWMRQDNQDQVSILSQDSGEKTIKYRILGYMVRQSGEPGRQSVPEGLDAVAEDVFQACAGTKNLIFANRKDHVEMLADLLNKLCIARGRQREYLVHHGSLSKEIREETEHFMRDKRPMTTLCSATLELGIDIGNVAATGQIGAPWSVSSLVQRLGRSGRGAGEPSVMRVYIIEDEPAVESGITDQLYTDLLQAAAMTELMLEKWVEPPNLDELDLSTLVQQILSVLAETGGIRADRLYERLVTNGVFRRVDVELFTCVLRRIAQHDLIEQMPTGDLILGLEGQRIVEKYDFYSAFMSPEEYRVSYDGSPIGSLPSLYIPEPGDHIVLAGRRWQIDMVDHDHREIAVKPAKGRKPPRFTGGTGEIHPRVRQKMRDVLRDDKALAYLNDTARSMLEHARHRAHIAGIFDHPLLSPSQNTSIWFTWTGTRIQRTLMMMGLHAGLHVSDLGIALEFQHAPDEVKSRYASVLDHPPGPLVLASLIPTKIRRKYDCYLDEELLIHSLAESALEVDGAIAVVQSML